MSEEQNHERSGYLVDLDAWAPTPAGTFAYGGQQYPALHFAQLRQDQQNEMRNLAKRLKGAKGMPAMRRVYIEAIQQFVPALADGATGKTPVDALMLEPIEKLDFALSRLLDPEGSVIGARPTKARRRKKSPSASGTAQ
jgi:hypothetical protein